MKKKIIALLLALTLVLSATACGAQSATDSSTPNDTSTEQTDSTNESHNDQIEETVDTNVSTEQVENTVEPGTLEALKADVMKDVEDSISALQSEMDTLVAEITTFDKYVENVDNMEAFYAKACTDSLLLEICLMEHAVTYAEFIMNSDNDFDDKYDDLDELYDVVYENAGDEFYDGIYDITEFAIPAGKIYLSALVDCFDGLLPTWTIGLSPNAELVNTMLDNRIALLSDSEHPVIHTDRGCHYRWPGWIERMEEAGLTRSMSKKGCSPDNSACEGVFGRLKNEMFYGVDWKDVTIDEFIQILNDYLVWYNEDRIKQSLNYLSPLD